MPVKPDRFTDPFAGQNDGVDRIKWVECDGGILFARNSGKVMAKYDLYRKADANSSTVSGFLEVDAVGATGGHPVSVSSNDKLPINFGLDKTTVMPTSNRVAVEADRGSSFAVLVDAAGRQFIDMNTTGVTAVVTVEDLKDTAGEYVSVGITQGKRYGNI